MHLDVLTPERQRLFGRLPQLTGFYLAGGTALALQLGHRQSIDFDLFTGEPIARALLQKVEQVFADHRIEPLVNTVDELTVRLDDTKLTFLVYPFPVLDDLVNLAGVPTLSVPELAVTKAYTIGRRGVLKDYVDLYTVINGGHATLQTLSERAIRKYGERFNPRLFLEQLIWLEDVDDEPILFLGEPVSKQTIQSFFEDQVRNFSLDAGVA